MMYREDIQKEIDILENDIKRFQRRYDSVKRTSFEELIKLRKRQLAAFKRLLPKAPEKLLASQYISFTDWRYEPQI